MSIESLLNQPLASRKLHLQYRYPSDKLATYEAELQRLLELVGNGVMPSFRALSRYFRDEHGMEVSYTTIGNHIEKLKRGESLWPTPTH